MTKDRYTVVGAGAIGGTIAHALIRAGHDVEIVDADAEHVAALRADGLGILRDDGPEPHVDRVPVARAFTPDDAPAGTIRTAIVAVKSQHTDDAARWLAPRLASEGTVLSLQNGRNEPVLAAVLGGERVVGGFVNIFADAERPGVIRYGGAGALAIGRPDGGVPDAAVLRYARDLRAYGHVRTTADLPGFRWAKRGFAAILGLASLVDADLAEVVRRYPELSFAAANESTEVAVRHGIVLEAFDAYEPYAFQTAAPADVRDSALARLADWLDGQPKRRSGVFRDIAVRRRAPERGLLADDYDDLARTAGVPVDLGRDIRATLHEIAEGRASFGWAHLDLLRDRHLAASTTTSPTPSTEETPS